MSSPIDLVIVSSVHWHFTWQRHHEIASGLARRGFRVHFVEPIPKRWPRLAEAGRVAARLAGRHRRAGLVEQPLPAGVTLVNPRLLPDVGPVSRRLNRAWLGRRSWRALSERLGERRVVLHYLPLEAAIDLQRRVRPAVAIYDCVWDWSRDPYSKPGVLRESALLEAVDLVFADAPWLFERQRARHPRVHRVLPAVDWERWAPARDAAVPRDGGRSRCAYFGAIGANLDLELLARLSREVSLRLIGPVQVPLDSLDPAAEILGPRAVDELPELVADADVLVLPYRSGGHVRGVIPAKTFECLATGKPVVASGLDSLAEFGDAFRLVTGADAFVAAVDAAAGRPAAGRERRLELARANSWRQRLDEIEALVRDALDRAEAR